MNALERENDQTRIRWNLEYKRSKVFNVRRDLQADCRRSDKASQDKTRQDKTR